MRHRLTRQTAHRTPTLACQSPATRRVRHEIDLSVFRVLGPRLETEDADDGRAHAKPRV